MSTPRRRRWMDVLRRTMETGDESANRTTAALSDAALWRAHEQASRSIEASSAHAERLVTASARQRGSVDGAAERAGLVAARSEGLSTNAARVSETFERLGVVGLNAGLEGARLGEPHGRALLLLAEEIRVNVRRGAEAAEQLGRVAQEIAAESVEVRAALERSRGEAHEVGQEAAQLSASTQQANRSLTDLAARLRKATGVDLETARTVAIATEHARGLVNALSALPTTTRTTQALKALGPLIGPLLRLLGELEEGAPESEGDKDGEDAP